MDGSHVSLVQTAARLLRERPRHTLELAEELLKLSGTPETASAVIRALLKPDPRFRLDGEGVWWLEEAFRSVGSSLSFLDYAVVDLETTGGAYGAGHRILEVAVVMIKDGTISGEFRSLVNPGRSIPPQITRLTGISEKMVEDAPYFDEIAEQLLYHLENRVFVAHNVRFDWSFMRDQLEAALGVVPDVQRICTVRMSRRLLPRLTRHHLDAIARHYNVPIHGRHRAYGDALATARILLRLLDEAGSQGIADLHALVHFLGEQPSTRTSPPDTEDAA